MSHLAGIILCGGASRRMGQDKAWLPIGGETMLQRVARIVGEVCEPVVVVAGPTQRLPELPATILVCRDAEEYLGPANGLRRGFEETPDDRPVFVCGCDMPFVSADLIRFLLSEYREGHAVVPVVGGVRQPLGAIFARNVNQGRQSLREILDTARVIEVNENKLREVDPQLRSFMRINDPQSYKEAVALVESGRET